MKKKLLKLAHNAKVQGL